MNATFAEGDRQNLTMSRLEMEVSDRSAPVSTQVYEIDPLRDPRWADFVQTHPHASVFHSRSWLRALRDAYGYAPSVLCTSPIGEQITDAVVFCRIRSCLTGSRIVSLPFSDHCEPLVTTPVHLDAILQQLQAEVQADRWNYLELRPTGQTPGMTLGLNPSSTYFWHSIDLSKTRETLFKSFHKDCVQRRIRRAERESLEYEVGNSEALLQKFFLLFVMTRRRHYLPPQPYAWFRHLSRSFGDQLQVRLISYRGRPISSILTLKHGQTLTYKYGCSDIKFNYLGGMPLLFWRTIEEVQNEGFTRFDLGRSNVDNSGLVRFKENWGAQRMVLKYLTTSGANPVELSSLGRFVRRVVCPIAPNWSLVTLGKFLYGHLG